MPKEEVTKTELLGSIRWKVRRANPMVGREFDKLLRRSTRVELERISKKVRVTKGGDISLI